MGSETSYRMTRQRKAVLAVLQAFREQRVHPTTDEVYVEVRRTLPRISLATVYRNLDVLSQQSLVQRLDIGSSPVRFDGDTSAHMHIRCVRCDRLDDLHGVRVDIGGTEIPAHRGYEIIGLRAEFIGVCQACRNHGSTTPKARLSKKHDTVKGGRLGSNQGNTL